MSPHTLVIFGASGDLTSRKLIPALYELCRKRRLPEQTRIVGFSRTPYSHEAWREELAGSTAEFVGKDFSREVWDSFAPSIFYHPGNVDRPEDFDSLKRFLEELEGNEAALRVYYLATAPRFFEPAVISLGAAGMVREEKGPRRVVVEKPFGTNLASARKLNAVLHQVFDERQVYRIDHYLGKETVQNLIVFRFANAIFEPLWNRRYVDHVEITAAEEVLVGHRGGYYDTSGVLRDMFQNHLLQQLALCAMEPPVRYEADAIRDEKAKILRAIRPMQPDEVARDTLRGQYRGYREEPGVSPESHTETFAAVKFNIETWRWQGVPFFLRSGKGMSCRTTQIVVQFRQPPMLLFESGPRSHQENNRLVIQIQPAEGIQLHFHTKVPDAGMKLRLTDLNFRFRDRFSVGMPDAYQRLLLDVMHGDPSLFARADEVELAWGIIDPITAAWSETNQPPLYSYEPGGWGPVESIDWIESHGHTWFDYCPVLSH